MLPGSFDIIIAGIIVFSVITGYISGLVMQLASLLGLVCCAFFAGKAATIAYPFFVEFTGIPDYILIPLSYLLSFILIMIAFYAAGKLLDGFMKAIRLNMPNRLAGSLFSVAKWLMLTSILLNLLVIIDKDERVIKHDIKENSLSYPLIKPFAPSFIPFLEFTGHSENVTFK
jgi:membrane protein required for colicin V production